MKARIYLALVMFLVSSVNAKAVEMSNGLSTVDYSIIRSVGAICGAGLSIDAKGDVDAKITRIFGGGVEATGQTRLDIGRVEELLKQFSENDGKQAAYQLYVSCVIQTLNSIIGMSKETDSIPVIDNLLIPDPLVVIKNGQKFAMEPGQTRAICSNSLIFTLNSLEKSEDWPNGIRYSYSDMEKAYRRDNQKVYQANAIKFNNGCSIVPYLIDVTEGHEKASFYTKCKP